jgi:tRNA pseudouridine55 synthase
MTSHDVVAQVRRLFRTRAVGHTGPLDPFATGVLVLVFGRATRLARFVEAETKTYVAEARLGLETTTGDATGDPVGDGWRGPWPAPQAVRAALQPVGAAPLQLPPAFSAKRVGGRRSHDLARRGEAVTLAPVAVRIDRLDVLSYAPPTVGFEAVVGPGTYIRAVARDLGRALGTGAHLVALRRHRPPVPDILHPLGVQAHLAHPVDQAARVQQRLVPGQPAERVRVGRREPSDLQPAQRHEVRARA